MDLNRATTTIICATNGSIATAEFCLISIVIVCQNPELSAILRLTVDGQAIALADFDTPRIPKLAAIDEYQLDITIDNETGT